MKNAALHMRKIEKRMHNKMKLDEGERKEKKTNKMP